MNFYSQRFKNTYIIIHFDKIYVFLKKNKNLLSKTKIEKIMNHLIGFEAYIVLRLVLFIILRTNSLLLLLINYFRYIFVHFIFTFIYVQLFIQKVLKSNTV